MSDDPNILEPEWDVHMPEAPFHARASRIAHRAGSERVGATLYELDPGGASAPYHLHYANEELLVVLGGRAGAAHRGRVRAGWPRAPSSPSRRESPVRTRCATPAPTRRAT